MSVAVMKTKTETALVDGFGEIADTLPGGGSVKSARAAALARFAGNGLPHRRIEEWKYTDLKGLMKEALPVVVDGESKTTIADVIVAMGALGLTTHVSAVRRAGARPLLLAALLFAWLVIGGLAVNGLVGGW